MSGYQESRWHEDCFGRCDGCSTCLHRDGEPSHTDGLYKRFVTMGSVRYGMRLGAVSPPPPGAGPRYRSQCCWPTTATVVPGPVSRIPLLTTAPINSFDIISCANRVRMTEDATSELPQQATVRDHVLYSTKCMLKSQLKRCALVRPQVYARLCEHNGNGEAEDLLNNLDRLPRFRFGGNRASTNKARDFEKRANEQRLRDLTDRLKRGPVPPPRTRHSTKTPPAEALLENDVRATPLRSASFSQVDYCPDDKKYVRRRHPSIHHEPSEHAPLGATREVATLPRSRNNLQRVSATPNIRIQIPKITTPDTSSPIQTDNLNKLYDMINSDIPERDNEDDDKHSDDKDIEDTPQPLTRSNTTSTAETPNQGKKRDKSRRRKGIYISQWPNSYHPTENVIPQFVEDGDFASCSDKDSIAEISKLAINDDRSRDFPIFSSPQEEPLSPEENQSAPEWPFFPQLSRQPSHSPDDKDSLKITSRNLHLLRSDSLSEGEPEIGERKLDQIALTTSDVSDCESRISVGDSSPGIPRRYSKRPLRGPYGQMLEAEMKKPETGRKNQLSSDLKFLEDLTSLQVRESKPKHSRSRASCNSSLDETHSKGSCNSLLSSPKAMPLSKRKVSADCLVVGNENEPRLVVSHQRTTSSPSKLEGFTNTEVSQELLQQLLRGSSEQLAASDANLQQRNDTRTHVVVELYDNERTYVESLQILVTKYLEPLKSPENANLLDAALVDEIFYQIPFLLNHHQTFLEEMKKRLDHWDLLRQKIGDVFLEMFSKPCVIESYTNYVNNWKRARDIIKSAQQSKPAFARFLETTAREHKGKLALDSLLIKPIQKFPKYELLLQRLIKHTDIHHPDHSLLIAAQKEVHDQLLKINCTEREALELEQLREIEALIEGLIELVAADRQYLRHDLVTMAAGGGTRKERALFLFSDLLLVTSIKRRSGTIRKPTTGQGSVTSTLEANKYKLLMKIALGDLEIVKPKDEHIRQMMADIENLSGDLTVLNQMNELSWTLHCSHGQLDDLIKDMLTSLNKQLIEQQNSDSQLSCVDLTLNTSNGLENISIAFSKPDKRAFWEESFNDAKQKLAISGDRRACPELLATVPIRKTRAGLQFTCAAPSLGDNGKDVWVCNSDGYVGQVCILSLHPEATVTSCNSVCSARILCIASVPGVSCSLSVNNRGNNNREENEEPKTIQFDSSSSSEEDEKSDNEEDDDLARVADASEVSSIDMDDIDSHQSTIWLGTEDGCIHVYNSSDNIRIKKNKIRLQHGSAILSIIYLDNRVFIALANGEISIYDRDACGWNVNLPTNVAVGTTSVPISKMLSNAGKLWCGCGNTIKVFNTQTLLTESNFTVNNDSNKPVSCIVLSGHGLWLALQNSAVVKCFHVLTFEALCEVNVAPSVTKMLTSCDDIIRQHKAACLRVTSLLACKDLLWIGTSAGVLLTMALPHVMATTTKLSNVPAVAGVSHGHTGHVRFLTSMEIGCSGEGASHRNSYKGKPDQRSHSKLLVISGGDGYEDFRSSNLSEVAGREDSTNHLLLWNI